jgi:hypothetical protein
MSKVEHDSWRESGCLCGKGQVTRHVSSTDYPFGGADTSYSLDCPHCLRTWRLDGRMFVDRATEARVNVAYEKLRPVSAALRTLASAIIDRHMAGRGLRTRKAELAELERLGLSAGTYRSYAKARSNGQSPGQAANLYAGLGDLLSIAGGDAAEITKLSALCASLKAEWTTAGSNVLRRLAA